jgi:hypothetical protein
VGRRKTESQAETQPCHQCNHPACGKAEKRRLGRKRAHAGKSAVTICLLIRKYPIEVWKSVSTVLVFKRYVSPRHTTNVNSHFITIPAAAVPDQCRSLLGSGSLRDKVRRLTFWGSSFQSSVDNLAAFHLSLRWPSSRATAVLSLEPRRQILRHCGHASNSSMESRRIIVAQMSK